MITFKSKKHIDPPIAMGPSDTLGVTYKDVCGNIFNLDTIRTGRYLQIDTIMFYDVKDELGFKDGIAAIVGESSEYTN